MRDEPETLVHDLTDFRASQIALLAVVSSAARHTRLGRQVVQ
jgi:hypothetical protein